MSIKLLSSEIINQIAAGEVIENPAGAIKELIENSIDAGSTDIEISLEESGLKKIQITDNGCGISKEDLLKAPLRHATSKISDFNDLYNISTMGFRGEALASIFSIAKTKLISKTNFGTYEISYDNLENVKESSCSKSTTVIIEDIFYNTPARKKYLKSSTMELKSVLDIVNRFEISYPSVKITLKNNNKILVNKPVFDNFYDNLCYVLGKELKGNLIEFENEKKGLKISGFIGKPSNLTYAYKKNQYVFVNSRFVKSKLINDAIYEGFGSNLMVGRHPFFTLYVEIDPQIIDVNVHPTKIEIKFENELEIYEFVASTVREQFEKKETFKEFEVQKELDDHLDEVIEHQVEKEPKKNSKYFTKEKQRNFEVRDDVVEYQKTEKTSVEVTEKELGPLAEALAEYKILGQLDKTYIIVETPKEMILVDQHIAEEKYLYETFMEDRENENPKTQQLLSSVIIHLTSSEMLLFDENSDIIKSIGFDCEKFGENEIRVSSVPINIRGEVLNSEKIKEMLYNILINKKIKCVEDEKHSKIASIACRSAIMAGDELTMPQMKQMVENLKYLKQPFNCPHGRPTFLRYNFYELQKKFKRVV